MHWKYIVVLLIAVVMGLFLHGGTKPVPAAGLVSDPEIEGGPSPRAASPRGDAPGRPGRPICSGALEWKVDRGHWVRPAGDEAAVTVKPGERVFLRVPPQWKGSIRWYRVIPDIGRMYGNAVFPWEPGAYKWKGIEKIRYYRKEMTGCRNMREIEPLAETSARGSLPDEGLDYWRSDMGSFWFQAESIDESGAAVSTPGPDSLEKYGLSGKVTRVSVMGADGYLGYLTTFFNVPGVFGSVTFQSENYIGVDCADVLVAAMTKLRGKPGKRNHNVAGLVGMLPVKAKSRIRQGVPDSRLRWGRELKPGMFLAVRFEGARQFQHIGALWRDSDSDGLLGPADTVIHAGPMPLQISTLEEGFFDGEVVFLDHASYGGDL